MRKYGYSLVGRVAKMEIDEETKIVAYKDGKPMYYIVFNDDLVSSEDRKRVQKAIQKALDIEDLK